MARRRRSKAAARQASAAEPGPPQTEVQRAASAIRKRAAAAEKLAKFDAGIPPPEQLAKGVFRSTKIKDPDAPEARFVRRNLSTRNLERWYGAGKIDERQYQAGDRYRSDWERTGFEPRMTASYGITSTGGGDGSYIPAMPGSLVQMDAWRAFKAAQADLGTMAPGFDAMAVHDQLAQEIDPREDRTGLFTLRTSILVVKLCLDRLVVFYRL